MRKLIIVLLVILGLELAGLVGYYISYSIMLKRPCVTIESLTRPGLTLTDSEKDQGFFCATYDCARVGVRGTLFKYDPDLKLITLQLNERMFWISLTKSTIVDNSKRTPFFESTQQQGDVLIVIFDRTNPSKALEVYFIKTGAVLQKRNQ